MSTSNHFLIKTVGSIAIGMSFILMPLFVFANGEDADIVPHDDAVEEVIQIEENEGFVGDGHTDHTHITPVSTIPWWQSTMWWSLFLISLLLMAVLSFGVYKYLEDKPREVVLKEEDKK